MQEVCPELKKKDKKSVNIKKYKARRELNLGIFLFAIVFIYLVVNIILFFTNTRVSVYEVREGSIVKDNSYTGLIIREETAIPADDDGYISYYQNENSKVRNGMNIYALSPEKLNTQGEQTEDSDKAYLNPEAQSNIVLRSQNFIENYNSNDFSSVYTFKNEVNTILQNAFCSTRTQHLDSVIANSGLAVSTYKTASDGIVAFTVDGLESLTVDSFTKKHFDRSNYESKSLSDQMKITAGQPVYRLITSEHWSVIVPLTKEVANELKKEEVSTMKVRIDKDSETLWAKFKIIYKNGDFYGQLDFDNSMIRYAEERYLNIELILEDESGLKIPKSSVVDEQFYVIPSDYLTKGGNSNKSGVMVKQNDGSIVFQEVTIYDESSKNEKNEGDICISQKDLHDGDVIMKPESSDTFTIGQTKTLQGVYNINKGYAVFKKVTVLCENDEYYIVDEGEPYGLYNYDHIVQDGSTVNSDEVIFQ